MNLVNKHHTSKVLSMLKLNRGPKICCKTQPWAILLKKKKMHLRFDLSKILS